MNRTSETTEATQEKPIPKDHLRDIQRELNDARTEFINNGKQPVFLKRYYMTILGHGSDSFNNHWGIFANPQAITPHENRMLEYRSSFLQFLGVSETSSEFSSGLARWHPSISSDHGRTTLLFQQSTEVPGTYVVRSIKPEDVKIENNGQDSYNIGKTQKITIISERIVVAKDTGSLEEFVAKNPEAFK